VVSSSLSKVNIEQQLKLQAFLDGELPEKEARDMAALVARDAEAADLVAELRNTRRALAAFEPVLKVPESREFYWSKIERALGRQEPVPETASGVSLLAGFRRFLVPAGAAAALVIVAAVALVELGSPAGLARAETETTSADSGTFTYQDDSSGTTLVWLTYPAESGFAEKAVR
jgi:anti-sigma factor RsiW